MKQAKKIPTETIDSSADNVNSQIIHETDAMVKFAMSRGIKVNPSVVLTLDQVGDGKHLTPQQLKNLVNHHNSLVILIKPALPKNVVYLAEREAYYSKRKKWYESKFPMLRKLLVFSFCSTMALIITSLSATVSPEQLAKGILHSSGFVLLNNFLFLSSAAAIGASFLVLSNIKSKFTDGTYHPDQDGSFWITILLGIIGGIIMSELISIDPGSTDVSSVYVNNKMLYALLGGFSSKLVYNVMNKIISAVESLVAGGADAKADSDLDKVKNDADIQVSKVQLNMTGQLSALQSKIQQMDDPNQMKQDISNTINSIFEDLGIVDVPVQDSATPPSNPAQDIAAGSESNGTAEEEPVS